MTFPLQSTFVFQPGGTNRRFSDGLPIYTDWAEMYVDFLASNAVQKTILIDDTFDAAPTIPAGTYNLAGAILEGRQSVQLGWQVNPTIPTGVLLLNPIGIRNINITLGVGISTPIRYNVAVGPEWRDCSFTVTGGGNPIVEFVGVNPMLVVINNTVIGTGGSPVLSLQSSSHVICIFQLASSIRDDMFAGGASEQVSLSSDASCKVSFSHSGFTGTFPTRSKGDNIGDADDLAYLPGASGNWTIPPTNIGSALDAIATTLSILNGGPI